MLPYIIPNYHPIFVHFTIALIVVSLGSFIFSWILTKFKKAHHELLIVSRWSLWFAGLLSIGTLAAGFHAFYTVNHNAISHAVMITHRSLGISSFVLIELLAIWSIVLYIKDVKPKFMFGIGLIVATACVIVTGWYGAELVFRYGAGVVNISSKTTVIQQNHGSHKH